MKKLYVSVILSSLIAAPVFATSTSEQHLKSYTNQDVQTHMKQSKMSSQQESNSMMDGKSMENMLNDCRKMMDKV
ncbi:hypothetical protein KI743_21580 [Vibrio sp. D420a]|jgi:uncharacterized protein involved in copper resistance|uniref:hypothetical protein n=1 Tax=Vibrio TaxID=662 RepID=UPI0012692E6A|nr:MULTISPECIES: hypothetical protein [unclassified Vibrio]MDK9764596.1 hypothetical protein [Vibrio sp. D420a]QFT13341.1 hypothetical protein FIV04_25660 [Vibrio sp. THAF190c]